MAHILGILVSSMASVMCLVKEMTTLPTEELWKEKVEEFCERFGLLEHAFW